MLLSMNVEIERNETSRNSFSSMGSCVRLNASAIQSSQAAFCVDRAIFISSSLRPYEPALGPCPECQQTRRVARVLRGAADRICPVQQFCPIGAPERCQHDRILQYSHTFLRSGKRLVQTLDPLSWKCRASSAPLRMSSQTASDGRSETNNVMVMDDTNHSKVHEYSGGLMATEPLRHAQQNSFHSEWGVPHGPKTTQQSVDLE